MRPSGGCPRHTSQLPGWLLDWASFARRKRGYIFLPWWVQPQKANWDWVLVGLLADSALSITGEVASTGRDGPRLPSHQLYCFSPQITCEASLVRWESSSPVAVAWHEADSVIQ